MIICGDCLDVLPTLDAESVDACVTDPPYPEIDRPYGRMSEPEWHAMMRFVVAECRRIIKPTGSAVFILQSNSERVGRMRPWLWEFMAWTAREWNQVQDAWWWNNATPPTVHCHRTRGLMRPSMKACVWLGSPECYRDQTAVLLRPSSDFTLDPRFNRHDLTYTPSGLSMRWARAVHASVERGGVTPFNVIVSANSDSADSSGAAGHEAGTPRTVIAWWLRYIVPAGGTVLDPFAGAGTVGVVCAEQGKHYIGVEREAEYVEIAERRIASIAPLFADESVTRA